MNAREAARILLDARRTGRALAALAPELRPTTDDESYAIQDAQIGALGAIGGWKVGARSPEAEPNCAPLPASLILDSPQMFAPGRFPLRLVEAELGFTIGRDLPPRGRAYVESDMVAAVASVHATIEVLDSRYVDFRAVTPHETLADFATNGALVVGPARTAAVHVDQTRLRLALYCDEALALERIGGNTAGDVFRLLAWLANHAAARHDGLRAGMVVTTGSCIGMYPVAPGTRVRAAFDGLPPAEATI